MLTHTHIIFLLVCSCMNSNQTHTVKMNTRATVAAILLHKHEQVDMDAAPLPLLPDEVQHDVAASVLGAVLLLHSYF